MLDRLRWLGLEVKDLAPARAFYAAAGSDPDHAAAAGSDPDHAGLDLPVVAEADDELRLAVGDAQLRLRRPSTIPRGGLHTHFALATPPGRYDDWWERLSGRFDLEEHTFGTSRSLYLYDPDGNCVEIGERGAGDEPLTGIFEVVLEVADLDAAEALYADLGFETVDRGARRRRVRMTGPVDLELWEPQLGLAGARGGVHVDVGFATDDPAAAVEAGDDRWCDVRAVEGGRRVRDPDGHWLTFA